MKEQKIIAIVHEKGQYGDKVKYEFETKEEFMSFAKAMQICISKTKKDLKLVCFG